MFKTIDSETSSGECPFCKRDAFKFKEGSRWMFLCHNCQRYMPFDKTGIKEETTIQKITNFDSLISLCTPISNLDVKHPFRVYASKRLLPLDEILYTDKFHTISKYAETPVDPEDNERLILPLRREDGTLFGIQGRSLNPGSIRYITLMFDKEHPKLFGLDKLNTTQPITIVEGPIDSLFVKNCIAMAGSDANLDKYKTNSVIALDNEPRNPEIVSKMAKLIDNDFKIVIWPENIKSKDINDMVLEGIDVNSVIQNNQYSGLTGKIKLNTWKKV